MIKYGLPAAAAVVALGALGAASAAQAQMAPPMQPQMQNGYMTNANAPITGQPQPGPNDRGYTETETYSSTMTSGPANVPPMAPDMYARPVTPLTTWIPGHYDWDPSIGNYRYLEGQYIEAPRQNAQWIPGHWAQTPTAWIWINGGWN
jgi:hypothetical protein